MIQFLVETALLTHGLRSINNEELGRQWPYEDKFLCWVEDGQVVVDNMSRYLEFRKKADSLIRIACYPLDQALSKKIDGVLPALG
ncbi:MAG: hypothetical protein KBS83_06785, partial [Lachnospiraceae bacterium]|nr:hypothetical protein [Candidatus Equihabitans merdae]